MLLWNPVQYCHLVLVPGRGSTWAAVCAVLSDVQAFGAARPPVTGAAGTGPGLQEQFIGTHVIVGSADWKGTASGRMSPCDRGAEFQDSTVPWTGSVALEPQGCVCVTGQEGSVISVCNRVIK